ncbi:unnamed protein product [Periconia digitata]|uniref:Uncharacterized protein n=1 Tax=Periconia digitata TaxID=1303443 RepID=A0A9W4UQS3_9PLEO|nr:unnamed protein product [Periconia digitata]
MSTKDSPAATAAIAASAAAAAAANAEDSQAVTRWDRQRWVSVFSSHNPTIREVAENLGLGLSASSSTTNRGIPKFDNPDYRKLSSEVTRLSKELPKDRDALLDFAADPLSLDVELEKLLGNWGPSIWGRDTDRSCLLTPEHAKKTYTKNLYYEDPADRETLKVHLHRWIIIKACYYIRNMKLKRSSTATEFDTLADMETDDLMSPTKPHLLPSPNGTSISLSPSVETVSTMAGTDPAVRMIGGKKRKSSIFNSASDGEDVDSPLVKRPYQSHTLPRTKNSPRKSVKSFSGSPVSENIPPITTLAQGQYNGFQTKLAPTSAPETSRNLLTPLSSNHLNGTARPFNSAPPPASGPARSNPSGGFTTVNTSPPSKDHAARTSAPPPPTNSTYASPYDVSPHSKASVPHDARNLPKAPPPATSAPSQGFQAINSPPVANGTIVKGPSSRSNTPVPHHHHHHHHHHRSAVAPQRPSRSNTPISIASATSHSADRNGDAHAHMKMTSSLSQSSHSGHVMERPTESHPPRKLSTNPVQAAPAVQSTQQIQPHPGSRTNHVNAPAAAPAVGVVHYAPPVQPVLKSHPVESLPPVQPPTGALDISLLQCEVLGLLMQYFFPKSSSPPDEGLLFHRIESLWHVGAALFRKQMGQLYDLQSKILLSWLHERRMLSHLRRSLVYKPGVPASEMGDRLLAMNDIRIMRLKWKNMGTAEGFSSDDLLCRSLAVLTNTEGTECLFKDGIDRYGDGLIDFLREEDMRIFVYYKK